MKHSLTFLFITFVFISNISANIIFVKEGATGTGISWENATGDLQKALQDATSDNQIWVASGIYYPSDCKICNDQQRNISFNIPNGVEVYGGFEGTETRLGQRKWRNNATTLSGNIGRDDAFDNSFTVVSMKNVNQNTTLDGFIISDGNADNVSKNGDSIGTGAGLYNDGSNGRSNPTLRNCIFMYNQAVQGGALFNNGSNGEASPTLENCGFVSNRAAGNGGAIFNYAHGGKIDISINGCQFVGNEAQMGGGVFSLFAEGGSGIPVFDTCKFVTNKAHIGGGIFYLGAQAQPKLEACSFLNNQAEESPDWFIQEGKKLPESFNTRLANLKNQSM